MSSTVSAVRRREHTTVRRHDLDGLRALAVLLVAVYHVWIGRVSGGVDVFLFLSGFFVGGGVVRSLLRDDFSVGAFLARTARRLLPALFVVLLAILVATALLAPVTVWAETARQTIASLFSVENWYLASAGREYGSAAAVNSPHQHLWSMSVQGQLFLALGFIGALAATIMRRGQMRRYRRTALQALTVVCLVSFAWATVGVASDAAWAYFDTFGRAWEFLLGTVVALIVDRRSARSAPPRRQLHPAVCTILAWSGVAAILVTGIVWDGGDTFPGPAALLPLGGAVLLVLFPSGRGNPARVLEWRPVAAAGTYAYAFYLWHWPVLIFVLRLRGGEEPGWLAGTGILVLSAVLAWLTGRLVERRFLPARSGGREQAGAGDEVDRPRPRRRPRPGRFVPALGAAAAIVLVLPMVWLTYVEISRAHLGTIAGDLVRYPGASVQVFPELFSWDSRDGQIPSLVLAAEDKSRAVTDGCNSVEEEVVVCSYGDTEAERVLAVVGGSHTEQWVDALSLLGEETGFRVMTIIKWSCELVHGREGVEFFDDACVDWSANALETLIEERPDAVFTTLTRPNNTAGPGREMVPLAYERAWARLADAGIVTVAIRDNPWTGSDPVGCLSDSSLAHEASCGVPRSDVLDDMAPETQADHESLLLRPLDLTDVICPDDWCAFAQGGRIVYRDDHHLTNSWALSTVPILRERMLPLLGW
ncbi:acyltransferase family protein [Microbacterium proteolyticum]|uniref:acyltransferase family protein n=1 Tax=Microbacterium proteolyticum TaxID=1572644 RepID=UPI0035C23687